MLGVVLLSEYNELVHAFGNDQFRNLSAVGRSFSQDQEHHGQLSSSSGVSSSGSSGSPNVQYSSREQIHDEDEMIMEGNRRKQTGMQNNGNDGKTAGGDYKCRFKPSGAMAWEDQEQQQQQQDLMPDESLLLQQLMPLVALCRTRANAGQSVKTMESGDEIQCIQTGANLQVRIGNLPFSNLLMLIHAQSIFPCGFSSDRLFDSLIRCIDFHYGPQLQLIPFNSPHIQQLQRRCEQRMLTILDKIDMDESGKFSAETAVAEGDDGKEEKCQEHDDDEQRPFNQVVVFGGTHKFIQTTLMSKLRELASLSAKIIGRRCRCFFLHTGQLIASCSSHSPGESALASIAPHQLLSILQFALQKEEEEQHSDTNKYERPMSRLKCQTEQTWLYSKTLRRRQLHNLFVLSLNEHVDMICVAPAEQSQLIGCLSDCLELLEQISVGYLSDTPNNELLANLMEKCHRHLERIERLLVDTFGERNSWELGDIGGHQFLAMGGWQSQWDYLYDVPKTGAQIQHLWNRFRATLETHVYERQPASLISPSSSAYSLSQIASQQNLLAASSQSLFMEDVAAQQQYNYNSTVSSVYSTLEWGSMSAARSMSNSPHVLTAILEAQRGQLKRTLRALLNELSAWTSGLARTQTLPSIQSAVRHLIGHKLPGLLRQLDDQIKLRWTKGNPLRPAQLGLDMLAYRFTRVSGSPLHFQYAGEEQRELFSQLVEAFPISIERDIASEHETNEEKGGGGSDEEMLIARTNDGQLVLQFKSRFPQLSTVDAIPENAKKRKVPLNPFKFPFGLAKTCGTRAEISTKNHQQQQHVFHTVILFSRHVNFALAMKQSQKLMDFLAEQMDECFQSFQ